MNNKIKALILIGSIALFSEVFRLVNSARVNLDNKNVCVKYTVKELLEYGNTNEFSKRIGYIECK